MHNFVSTMLGINSVIDILDIFKLRSITYSEIRPAETIGNLFDINKFQDQGVPRHRLG